MRTRIGLGGLAALLAIAACAPASAPGAVGPTAAPSAGGAPTAAPTASAPAASSAPSATPDAAATSLMGMVIDINRDPMPGATVTARQGETVVATATTGADGSYALTLPAGDFAITAAKAGFTTRSQAVAMPRAGALNFGPTAEDQANPYFLADTPEVEGVDVKEDADTGSLELRVRLSEPLPADAREAFDERIELLAGRSVEFLRSQPSGSRRLKTTATWEDGGRVYVFGYAGPYLLSGATAVDYTLTLDQDVLDTKDPETQELEYEEMGIADEDGNAIGRGRADYAFVKPQIFPPALEMLTDPEIGYLVQDRRWRLSHDRGFTFTARKDTTAPFLTRVELNVDTQEGDRQADLLTLWFNEPMSAAKDRDELDWTRLSKDRDFLILNLAADEAGQDFKPARNRPAMRSLEVDPNDARIVRIEYPAFTFEDQEFVEVTLTPEAMDPAGNKPDPAKNRLTGPVLGG